ncbi:MAG: hypothetical protein HKM93_10980 [Desulfobacteraceae bacterium]|nr:hypothetical protein [Desulfobacteraceae bacterium]
MNHHTMSENEFERFSVLHRLMHIVAMVGFSGLAVTGLSLGFSGSTPARTMMWLMGGPAHAAWLHRFFALITYCCVIIHGLWFLYYKTILKGRLTGPDSLMPSSADVTKFGEHIGYFLGRRTHPPAFERFSYMEKIDYWALFIGMNTMGLTGLVLWFPDIFTRILPGYYVNIAQILHFYEAVLAVIVKVFIHVGMTTLRPAVFPADTCIFTGKISKHGLMTEHAGQWNRMAPDDSAPGNGSN